MQIYIFIDSIKNVGAIQTCDLPSKLWIFCFRIAPCAFYAFLYL